MAKKLLMNNTNSTNLQPIKDSLICWLEASDIKAGDTIWKDRSGNLNHFYLTSGAIKELNGVKSDGDLQISNSVLNGIADMFSEVTFEIDYFVTTPASLITLFESSRSFNAITGGFGGFFESQRGTFRTTVPSKKYISSDILITNKKTTKSITIGSDIVIYNDASKIYSTDTLLGTAMTNKELRLGQRNGSVGEIIIYGFRIYKKQLTNEEVSLNYSTVKNNYL